MSKITLIERAEAQRDYGFSGVQAIVQHPEHGRLYVCDGYGGEDQLRGGAVRWDHGLVIKLQPTDTLDSLTADGGWNEGTDILSAASNGYDKSRPVLDIRPMRIAQALGL